MAKVQLRKPAEAPSNGTELQANGTLNPLRVSGVVLSKAALIDALRIYVPTLADIRVTEDGEHFWLMLAVSDASSLGGE